MYHIEPMPTYIMTCLVTSDPFDRRRQHMMVMVVKFSLALYRNFHFMSRYCSKNISFIHKIYIPSLLHSKIVLSGNEHI